MTISQPDITYPIYIVDKDGAPLFYVQTHPYQKIWFREGAVAADFAHILEHRIS